ncbi:MAG: hypothetical protein MJK04_16965 [Psychrosphaera sp.]|nr:hypothetical protein [Psychrosphaera sp.]
MAGNVEQMTAVNQSTAQIGFEQGTLVFSLEGLYHFVTDEREISFRAFKKQLYAGSLNHDLATLGGKVDVYQSVEHSKSRLYCLVGLSHTKEQVTL